MGTDQRAFGLKRCQAPNLPGDSITHPCLGCGACCAFFRVAFYWREANREDTEKAVPIELTEDITAQERCMKGTNTKHNPKCIALKGRVGRDAHCSIYQNRSSTCKKFQASYENGEHNLRCDEARARHGLPPLTKQDFPPGKGPAKKVPGSEFAAQKKVPGSDSAEFDSELESAKIDSEAAMPSP